jgi:hypothetical protein
MHEISYAKYLASPQYRKFPFGGIIGWMLYGRYPTVEELQEQYAFTYYSTMNKAVTDVNNGSIGANEDAVKDTAVAGVYTDKDGGINVVLLKDTTETKKITISADMTVNLGGHTLTFENDYCGIVGEKNKALSITLDGRLAGSSVVLNGIDGGGMTIKSYANNHFVINGGTYIINETVKSDTYTAAAISVSAGGAATISDCIVVANCVNGKVASVQNFGTATITNCDITASVVGDTGNSKGIYNDGTATISDCNIRAYANYLYGDDTYYAAASNGVSNLSGDTLTINDCYVFGTHSGMQNSGTIYVNGGTYEGYGHGGIYFGGTGTTAYVRNATLKDSPTMPDGYTATSQHNGAGFYIGGGECNDNIKVYMDNCKLVNTKNLKTEYSIVLTSNYGHKNSTLYIKNTKTDKKIRVDGLNENQCQGHLYVQENVTYKGIFGDGYVKETTK